MRDNFGPLGLTLVFFASPLVGLRPVSAADLGPRSWGPPPAAYEALWAGNGPYSAHRAHLLRPHRRVMGGPDYVGSTYGLGKPAVSGIGPRPDWGRSSTD